MKSPPLVFFITMLCYVMHEDAHLVWAITFINNGNGC